MVSSLLLALVLVTAVQEQEADPYTPIKAQLRNETTLRCRFPAMRSFASTPSLWETNEWEAEGAETQDDGGMDIIVDSIDLDAATARLIGNAGGGNVMVIAGTSALNFVEALDTGTLNVISVYAVLTEEGDYYAAWSRHVAGFLGDGMVSQFLGQCDGEPFRIQ